MKIEGLDDVSINSSGDCTVYPLKSSQILPQPKSTKSTLKSTKSTLKSTKLTLKSTNSTLKSTKSTLKSTQLLV
jgi:hypothetical protein